MIPDECWVAAIEPETTPPLPDSWDDEPWPLDDPVPTPSFRPSNWSDTHTDPPQVSDLADEAWQYAVDHGVSMEQALATLQGRKVSGFHTGGVIPTKVQVWIDGEFCADLADVTDWSKSPFSVNYEPPTENRE